MADIINKNKFVRRPDYDLQQREDKKTFPFLLEVSERGVLALQGTVS